MTLSQILKFVDDKTVTYSFSGYPTDILQTSLSIEERKTVKYKLLINLNKSNVITCKFSKNVPPRNLIRNNYTLPLLSKIKLLDVIITDDLKWSKNTMHICEKVNRKICTRCLLKQFGLTKDELICE